MGCSGYLTRTFSNIFRTSIVCVCSRKSGKWHSAGHVSLIGCTSDRRSFQTLRALHALIEQYADLYVTGSGVNVPWAVDYLDTKFQFTITETCPVVIVLSQPDDRYFVELRGRYFYSLHFRVYKEDDANAKWIVRSMHNSGNESFNTRSVSAEIDDLKPGTYNVVFKVTAHRFSQVPTAESIIMKYGVERKEKLLALGRRVDYAVSKGNLRAMVSVPVVTSDREMH